METSESEDESEAVSPSEEGASSGEEINMSEVDQTEKEGTEELTNEGESQIEKEE